MINTKEAHKIRGIDKDVCTCEQKIAYNYLFSWTLNKHDKDYALSCIRNNIEGELSGTITAITPVNWKKYNVPMILELIERNWNKYIDARKPIFSSYTELGNFIN